ncbi:MAG: hypothetical protein DMD87_07620 [Candidatus Rokuibacteriota bacterium]|nr:MAG: hypothetical protein DMD87_07620 [Candidatus Rokubacteria bacterium]
MRAAPSSCSRWSSSSRAGACRSAASAIPAPHTCRLRSRSCSCASARSLVVCAGKAPALASVGWTEWPHAVAIFLVCAFAALALERIGFRLTIALSLAFLLRVVERRGALFTAVLSIAFAAGAFVLFDTLLRVPLPRGPLGL